MFPSVLKASEGARSQGGSYKELGKTMQYKSYKVNSFKRLNLEEATAGMKLYKGSGNDRGGT